MISITKCAAMAVLGLLSFQSCRSRGRIARRGNLPELPGLSFAGHKRCRPEASRRIRQKSRLGPRLQLLSRFEEFGHYMGSGDASTNG